MSGQPYKANGYYAVNWDLTRSAGHLSIWDSANCQTSSPSPSVWNELEISDLAHCT